MVPLLHVVNNEASRNAWNCTLVLYFASSHRQLLCALPAGLSLSLSAPTAHLCLVSASIYPLCTLMLQARTDPPSPSLLPIRTFSLPLPQHFAEIVGTPFYMAPEVLERCYGPAADVWSVGVVIYLMIAGCLPFNGNTDRQIIKAVMDSEPDFQAQVWQGVSQQAQDYVRLMLMKDPSKRASIDQLLAHPWMAGRTGSGSSSGSSAAAGAAAAAAEAAGTAAPGSSSSRCAKQQCSSLQKQVQGSGQSRAAGAAGVTEAATPRLAVATGSKLGKR